MLYATVLLAYALCFTLDTPLLILTLYVSNISIWVRSRRCGCLVTWFCYQLIAKPGNKTAAVSWPDQYNDGIRGSLGSEYQQPWWSAWYTWSCETNLQYLLNLTFCTCNEWYNSTNFATEVSIRTIILSLYSSWKYVICSIGQLQSITVYRTVFGCALF